MTIKAISLWPEFVIMRLWILFLIGMPRNTVPMDSNNARLRGLGCSLQHLAADSSVGTSV